MMVQTTISTGNRNFYQILLKLSRAGQVECAKIWTFEGLAEYLGEKMLKQKLFCCIAKKCFAGIMR